MKIFIIAICLLIGGVAWGTPIDLSGYTDEGILSNEVGSVYLNPDYFEIPTYRITINERGATVQDVIWYFNKIMRPTTNEPEKFEGKKSFKLEAINGND